MKTAHEPGPLNRAGDGAARAPGDRMCGAAVHVRDEFESAHLLQGAGRLEPDQELGAVRRDQEHPEQQRVVGRLRRRPPARRGCRAGPTDAAPFVYSVVAPLNQATTNALSYNELRDFFLPVTAACGATAAKAGSRSTASEVPLGENSRLDMRSYFSLCGP